MKYYDKLIFELSREGRKGYELPKNEFPAAGCPLPENLRRQEPLELPEVSELDVVRHYTNLSSKTSVWTQVSIPWVPAP